MNLSACPLKKKNILADQEALNLGMQTGSAFEVFILFSFQESECKLTDDSFDFIDFENVDDDVRHYASCFISRGGIDKLATNLVVK